MSIIIQLTGAGDITDIQVSSLGDNSAIISLFNANKEFQRGTLETIKALQNSEKLVTDMKLRNITSIGFEPKVVEMMNARNVEGVKYMAQDMTGKYTYLIGKCDSIFQLHWKLI